MQDIKEGNTKTFQNILTNSETNPFKISDPRNKSSIQKIRIFTFCRNIRLPNQLCHKCQINLHAMQMQCAKHNENKHNITNFPKIKKWVEWCPDFRSANISWFKVVSKWVSEWFTVFKFSIKQIKQLYLLVQVIQVIQMIQENQSKYYK